MTLTKNNLMLFAAMILSARSLFSMQLSLMRKINHKNDVSVLYKKNNHLRIINKHYDKVFICLDKKGIKNYGETHVVGPQKELTLFYDNADKGDVTCTALMMGPVITNYVKFPLKKNKENQLVKFKFYTSIQCLMVKHDYKIKKLLSRFYNQNPFIW